MLAHPVLCKGIIFLIVCVYQMPDRIIALAKRGGLDFKLI